MEYKFDIKRLSDNLFAHAEKEKIINEIKRNTENYRKISFTILLASIFLAVGLIIASIIYAYSNRYEIDNYKRIDKWSGKFIVIEEKK